MSVSPRLRRHTRTVAAVAVSLAAAGGLAACGGDDSSSAVATASSAASAAGSAARSGAGAASSAASSGSSSGQTLTADETEFKINLSSSSVPAGTYTITVKNDGKATHNLIVNGPGVSSQKSDTIQGGQQTTMTVTLQPGTYEVWCGVGNHKAAGMDTMLTVS